MPNSPLTNKVDLPTYKVLVEGKAIKEFYQVLRIEIVKEINRIASAEIVIMDGDPSEQKFEVSESGDLVPGKKVEISLGYHSTEEIAFKGIVVSQNIQVRTLQSGEESVLTIKCLDESAKMTVGRKSAYFKDKKDSEAITSVIGNYSVSKTVEATTFQHKKIVQYDCTDWDFVLSRAEINGLLVICNDGKLDVAKPDVSGSAVLDLTYGVDVLSFKGELDAQSQLESVTCKSWDGTQLKIAEGSSTEPSLNEQGNITGKKLSSVLGAGEINMTTTVPEDTSVLKSWASAKLQKSRLARVKGEVSFPGNTKPLPGVLISLSGFGERFNGDAYVSAVHHKLDLGKWTTTCKFGLDHRLFAENTQLNAPPASGLLPGIGGLQIGKVKQIDSDPDSEFRVLVDVPIIKETGDGIWARLANTYASDGIGTYFYPEVGDEVVLGFLNEDPRFAVILGSLYGSKMKPPNTPDADNKVKGIVTKSEMKLTFEEDKKIITVETPGGNKATLSDDAKGIVLEDQNGNKVTLDDSGIALDSPKDIKVTTKGNFEVTATQGVKIKATGDAAVEGNNVNLKANIALSAQGSASAALKASGQVEVKGAMVMIN